MKILILVEPGFGTDVYGSDDCGMQPFAERLKAGIFAGHEVDISLNGWDQNPPATVPWPNLGPRTYAPTAPGQWQFKRDYILETNPLFIVILGHSMGGAESIGFMRYLSMMNEAASHITVNAAVLFDPVKDPPVVPLNQRFPNQVWDVPDLAAAPMIYIPYQTNGDVVLIRGEPLPAPPGSGRINERHNEFDHIPTWFKQGITYAASIQQRAEELISREFRSFVGGAGAESSLADSAPPVSPVLGG